MPQQVTFKVTPELLATLEEQAAKRGMSVNIFARELVEQGLRQSLTGNHLDEFRELVGQLRQEVARFASQPRPAQPPKQDGQSLGSPHDVAEQVERLIQAFNERDAYAGELRELRQQLARMMATLHQYAAGEPAKEDAATFGKKVFERK